MKPRILLLALACSPLAHAALQVTEAPDPNVSPTTQINVVVGNPAPGITFTDLFRVDPSTAFFGRFTISGTDTYFFRETATPPPPGDAIASSSARLSTLGAFASGAVSGSDNWIYITKDSGTKAWAQLDVTLTTATVLRYVHDPANPTADFTLAQAIAAANPVSSDRDIQFRSVDFTTGVIEMKNYGPGTIDLSGWRFCTHDGDQVRRYSGSTGLDGVSIASGASLFFHFNNDAPANPAHINRSSVGGSFATPLSNDAYALAIYINGSFGTGANIADHLQWSHGGIDNSTADDRSDEAQSGGVWTHQSSWINTSPQTEKIFLTDSNNGVLHGPNDYLRLPDFQITNFERSLPSGDVIITFPDINNLSVNVQKANDITTNDWTTLSSTSNHQAFIDDETDPSGFYRVEPVIP